MSDILSLTGSVQTNPAVGSPSGIFALITSLDESMILKHKHQDTLDLTVDAPVSIAFGGVTNANVIMLKVTGSKIRARFTSADGSTQAVPVDPFFYAMSRTVPVTAIDLTRLPGVLTTVEIFLGEKT